MIGFATSHNYALALALLFAAGFLELTFNAMAQTLVQLNAHEEIRGRTLGLFNMASLGLRTFSGVTVGLIGSLIGVHWSLALSALCLLRLRGCCCGSGKGRPPPMRARRVNVEIPYLLQYVWRASWPTLTPTWPALHVM